MQTKDPVYNLFPFSLGPNSCRSQLMVERVIASRVCVIMKVIIYIAKSVVVHKNSAGITISEHKGWISKTKRVERMLKRYFPAYYFAPRGRNISGMWVLSSLSVDEKDGEGVFTALWQTQLLLHPPDSEPGPKGTKREISHRFLRLGMKMHKAWSCHTYHCFNEEFGGLISAGLSPSSPDLRNAHRSRTIFSIWLYSFQKAGH